MLEIIGTSLKDCIDIEKGKGDRIELVSSLAEGGLTPSYGLVSTALENVSIPLYVMLRPHNFGYIYDSYDLDVMREDAKCFYQMGVDHLVLGILNEDGYPDLQSMDYVLQDTSCTVTFHRAIDSSTCPVKSTEILNAYKPVTHILTSGGEGRAIDNLETLKKMKEVAKMKLVIGSGVNLQNASVFLDELGTGIDLHAGTAIRYENSLAKPVEVSRILQLKDVIYAKKR